MQTSPQGLQQIIDREGKRNVAYRDTRGIWTIGVGHTSMAGPPDVHQGLVISDQEVIEIFQRDIKKFEDTVNDAIKVDLTQNQFDALVSFCYNIGQTGFTNSSLVRDINSGASPDALDGDFMKWDKPEEIIGRRESEVAEFDA